ncbi:hypothetical protein QR680_015741 [Steinernema hermaphroditum]|uniref:Uncharacterized protein n=1 Tax=Steinernema hermaphroditum TaxID=289476 RepID=A0AA39H9V7_9BILA|nr:hypothetical protein QR680_015741 [Steinernema hermaphroditum]
MDLYIFHHDEFERRYNCSFKTFDEWSKYGVQNIPLGQLYLVLGTIYIVLYIPILIVMSRPKLLKHSCFKIMFFLGLVDITSTVLNCIVPGYLGLKGVVGCMYRDFLYITCSTALACWFCQCCTCTVLAINRCVDFWRPKWMIWLFEGKVVYFWILLCMSYFFTVFFFCTSGFFSSLGMAYFFDPYFLIPMEETPIDRSDYYSMFHSINNIVIVIVLPALYGFLILSVWWKSRGAQSASLSKMQRQLFFQAFWICFLNFSAALLYVYIQFFSVPFFFLIPLSNMLWQGSNGGAVLIYLCLNRTIRSGVLQLLCNPFAKYQESTSSAVHPSSGVGSSYIKQGSHAFDGSETQAAR